MIVVKIRWTQQLIYFDHVIFKFDVLIPLCASKLQAAIGCQGRLLRRGRSNLAKRYVGGSPGYSIDVSDNC